MILEQARAIRELEGVVRGYEEGVGRGDGEPGEPLRAVREDVERAVREDVERAVREAVEREWEGRVAEEVRKREEGERWAGELVRRLEKEKKVCIRFFPGFSRFFCEGRG